MVTRDPTHKGEATCNWYCWWWGNSFSPVGTFSHWVYQLHFRTGSEAGQHKTDSEVFLWTLCFICFLFLVFYIALIFCLFLFSSLWVFWGGRICFLFLISMVFVFWKWEKEHKDGQVGRWGGSGNCINSSIQLKKENYSLPVPNCVWVLGVHKQKISPPQIWRINSRYFSLH